MLASVCRTRRSREPGSMSSLSFMGLLWLGHMSTSPCGLATGKHGGDPKCYILLMSRKGWGKAGVRQWHQHMNTQFPNTRLRRAAVAGALILSTAGLFAAVDVASTSKNAIALKRDATEVNRG